MSTVQREVSSSETDLPTSLSTVKEKPILFHDKGLYKVVIQLELVQENDFIIKLVTACARWHFIHLLQNKSTSASTLLFLLTWFSAILEICLSKKCLTQM